MDETDDQLRSAERAATPYVERLADARRELAAAQEGRAAAERKVKGAKITLLVSVAFWLIGSAYAVGDRRLIRSQAAIAEAQRGDYQREIDALNLKLAAAQSQVHTLNDDKNRAQLLAAMRALYGENVKLRAACAGKDKPK